MEFVMERLILRPGKASDAESLYQYANDPATKVLIYILLSSSAIRIPLRFMLIRAVAL